ncbi:MAG: peptidylprolyl isomerase [bacterium]
MRHNLLFTLVMGTLSLSLSCGEENNRKEQTAMEQLAESTPDPERPLQTEARALANVAAKDRADYYASEPPKTIEESKKYLATVHTEKGDIVLELDPLYAPLHVNNFVFLARQGFFDGLTFHRVVPGFVIQGGDPLGTGTGGPGYLIPAEIGLPHNQGVVAMARRGDSINPERKSSGSQFYITLAPTHQLDGQYSVFGQVIAGFDVVQRIAVGDLMMRVEIEEK